MTTQPEQITISIDELLSVLEPLIRRVVREELTTLVKENSRIFYLEPDMPLYQDMEEILQRKAKNNLKFYSHEEVWVE